MTQRNPTRKPAERLVKDKPIPLRLIKSDRADAERIAKKQGCSLSAHARECYLLGKSILFPLSTSSPRKRVKRGGGGNPAPASLSSS